MTIQAGPLKRRVAIDRQIVTQNDTGEEIVEWDEVGTILGTHSSFERH